MSFLYLRTSRVEQRPGRPSPVSTTSNSSTRIRQLVLPVGPEAESRFPSTGQPQRLFRSGATADDIAERVYTGLEWGVSSVRSTCSANASSVRRLCVNRVRLMANPTAQRGAANSVVCVLRSFAGTVKERQSSAADGNRSGFMEWHLRACLCPYFPRDGWYGRAPGSLEHPAAPPALHLWIVVNSLPARSYNALSHNCCERPYSFAKRRKLAQKPSTCLS